MYFEEMGGVRTGFIWLKTYSVNTIGPLRAAAI
jgi:hypothetical protein